MSARKWRLWYSRVLGLGKSIIFMPDISPLPCCGGRNSLVMKFGTKFPMITDGEVEWSYEFEL